MALAKAQLIETMFDKYRFPKTTSSNIVKTLLEIIKKSLESGEDFLISKFGKFCVKEK